MLLRPLESITEFKGTIGQLLQDVLKKMDLYVTPYSHRRNLAVIVFYILNRQPKKELPSSPILRPLLKSYNAMNALRHLPRDIS